MNDTPLPKPTCAKCHAELSDLKPRTAKDRRKFCDAKCRKTAWKRSKAGRPIADPLPELDELVAEKNRLAAELQALQPRLESTTEKLQEAANTKRRLSYAAEVADTNADTKISHHGAAMVTARTHAEEAEQAAAVHRSESARLRDENAVLRDRVRQALEQVATAKAQRTAPATTRPRANQTLATQVYWAFHRLAKDHREMLRGTDPDDAAYRLFDHAARNRDRLQLNTTEVDARTLYYFSRLTRAAYQRAQKQNSQDVPTQNAVKLHNTVSKLVKIPATMPPLGEAVQLPPTSRSDQP